METIQTEEGAGSSAARPLEHSVAAPASGRVSTSAKATLTPPVASFWRSPNQAPASAVVTAALAVS